MYRADPQLVKRYFDHGSTSFPKPAVVSDAMTHFIERVGGTYGRAAYSQAHSASVIVFETRNRIANLIDADDSSRIVFTLNATGALNLAIGGMCRRGGVVLVSPLEHNSVMRPLSMMERDRGVTVRIMPHGEDGTVDWSRLDMSGDVCLAVVCAQSNVNGVIQPFRAIKRALGEVPLLLDASQAIGETTISVADGGLDLVAAPGHKHLLGPTGTGFLYVRDGIVLPPLTPGGTGSDSEKIVHPSGMPDSLEGGTPNTVGIAGLGAAVEFLESSGSGDGPELARQAIGQVRRIPGARVLCADDPEMQGGLFSVTVDGLSPSVIARRLFERHKIAVRAGLHCAPIAHKTLGTAKMGGTVRISFGRFHDGDSVDTIVGAMIDVTESR